MRVELYPPQETREIFGGEGPVGITLHKSLPDLARIADLLAQETLNLSEKGVSERSLGPVLEETEAYAYIAVHLIEAPLMRAVNDEQRGIPEVTDVLSFPLLEMHNGALQKPPLAMDFDDVDGVRYLQLGEILICYERLLEQAKDYGHSAIREGAFLFVHGLLHLLGYDHEEGPKSDVLMNELQVSILEGLGFTRELKDLPPLAGDEAPDYLPATKPLPDTYYQYPVDFSNFWNDEGDALFVDPSMEEVPEGFKSGLVTFVGRPNIGKSTLLNALMDFPLAITSRKAQTTRRDTRGVLHRPLSQIILVDTPGVAKGETRLEESMVKTQTLALQDADLIVLLVDARFPQPGRPEERLLSRIKKLGTPCILVINKVDLVPKEELLPLIANYAEFHSFEEIVPLSALKKDKGCEILVEVIEKHLPEQPPLLSSEVFTDQSERLLASELIRKQILENYHDELPYAMAVKIDHFDEEYKDGERQSCHIMATIYCETESQKSILYGKKFRSIQRLESRSAASIAELLDCPVDLELHAKVKKDWRRRISDLRDLGLAPGSDDGLLPLQ